MIIVFWFVAIGTLLALTCGTSPDKKPDSLDTNEEEFNWIHSTHPE